MIVWVVWEANHLPPKLFETKPAAYVYRTERQRVVKHQVYIAAVEVADV